MIGITYIGSLVCRTVGRMSMHRTIGSAPIVPLASSSDCSHRSSQHNGQAAPSAQRAAPSTAVDSQRPLRPAWLRTYLRRRRHGHVFPQSSLGSRSFSARRTSQWEAVCTAVIGRWSGQQQCSCAQTVRQCNAGRAHRVLQYARSHMRLCG